MCYCQPDIRTPWCPQCTTKMYDDLKAEREANKKLEEMLAEATQKFVEATAIISGIMQRLVFEHERADTAINQLEIAKNGLKWYMDSFPDAVTEADYEEMAKIDAVLELYSHSTQNMEPT